MTVDISMISDWPVAACAPHGKATPMHSLKANGHSPQPPVRPRERRLTGLWRYDPAKGAWERIALPAGGAVASEMASVQVHFRAGRPAVMDVADGGSLYWVEWREEGQRAGVMVESTPAGSNGRKAASPPDGSAATRAPCPASTPAPFVPRSAPLYRERAAAP